EDVLAETASAFTQGRGAVARNGLEAVPTEQADHLAVALRAGEHQGAAPDASVLGIGPYGEVARELPQRLLETDVHLPRPRDRCPFLQHRRDLLVPKMQVDETVAGTAGRAVRQHEIAIKTGNSDAENAAGVASIFDDGLPAAQRAVDPEDDAVQPRVPASANCRPDELQSPERRHWVR